MDRLKSIRTAPDSRAVHLLVKRIDVVSDNEKTDFNVVSTLESVSEKLGRIGYFDTNAPRAKSGCIFGFWVHPKRNLI